MRRIPLLALSLMFVCSLWCTSAVAQSYLYNVGNQQWGTNLPIENGYINVNNGQIHLEFPSQHTPSEGTCSTSKKSSFMTAGSGRSSTAVLPTAFSRPTSPTHREAGGS